MLIRDFFTDTTIGLDLAAATKDDALEACVRLLGVDARAEATLLKALRCTTSS